MFLLSKPLRLRGLKSKQGIFSSAMGFVEAFAASWIEIVMSGNCKYALLSKPLRLRGLKSTVTSVTIAGAGRSLCGFVD